jgi:hypothetical protein
MNDKTIKKVVLPLTAFKQRRTTQFSENQVVGGLGNEGLDLAEWIQDRIDDGTIDPVSAIGTDLGNQIDVDGRLIVTSSTGVDVTMTQATTTNDGVMSKTDKINLAALSTLSGVATGALNLSTFSGTIIPDNSTIKQALQSLETAVGSISGATTGNLTSVSSGITVTGGSNAVLGSGTQLSLNPSLILLSSLGGDLRHDQIEGTGVTTGQLLRFDGTNWTAWTPTYTNIVSGSVGDILYYNGSSYVPATPRRFIQVINSGNTITTPHTPISTLITDVYINGILQEEGVDYTQLGNLFTFAIVFNTNNKVIIKYYT